MCYAYGVEGVCLAWLAWLVLLILLLAEEVDDLEEELVCDRGLAASVDDEVGLGNLHEGDGRLGQRVKEWLRVWGNFWAVQNMRVFLVLGQGEGMVQVEASRDRFVAGRYSCMASGASVPYFYSPPTVWGRCKFFPYDMLGGLFQYLVSV